MSHKKIVIECESDVFWVYDADEKNLLLYTDKVNAIARWLESNMMNTEPHHTIMTNIPEKHTGI
jgi:hypothetical protein